MRRLSIIRAPLIKASPLAHMRIRDIVLALCVLLLSACAQLEQRDQVMEPQIKIVEKVIIREVPKECPVLDEKTQQTLDDAIRNERALLACQTELHQALEPSEPTGPITHTRFPIIGEVEWVSVNEKAHRFKARIDTGAATSSIHAEDIQLFERDGRTWASFLIFPHRKEEVRIKAPITRKVGIKQHDSETDRRYVVELTLMMGSIKMHTEVNLNDRSEFIYPLLIGRSFLEGHAIVDTSQRFMMLD